MLLLFPGWVQVHRKISTLILRFEVSHGEHPHSCRWLFCILSFTSSTTAAHFPAGFMEKDILVISLPKHFFFPLPVLSPQKAFIKVMQAHVLSMFVWIHPCMHIHVTFTFDKCSNKQNFSHMSALKKINVIITIKEVFFLHLGRNIYCYKSVFAGQQLPQMNLSCDEDWRQCANSPWSYTSI